jgi:N-methylhydantoinase B
MLGIELKRGERLRLQTPGGGGFGDVKKRDPKWIEADEAGGYVHPGAQGARS